MSIALREVEMQDLPVFFRCQQDPQANYMAAFTAEDPNDWEAFSSHWRRILADPENVNKTIIQGQSVVGHIASFEMEGEREVSYWVDRAFWNRGIATAALKELLLLVTTRPLYARAAKDNLGSRRVLEKCGFVVTGEGSGYAHGPKAETEEYLFTLR